MASRLPRCMQWLTLATIFSITAAKLSSPSRCLHLESRELCLAVGNGTCAYCIATEKCVPKEKNDCPDGCLFEEANPRLKSREASPSCHILREPNNSTHYDEDFALRMVTLAGAAYCPKEQIRRWNCRGNKCVEGFHPKLVITDEEYQTLAFAGIDYGSGKSEGKLPRLVLVFRGTVEVDYMNWVADMDILKSSPYENKIIEVHRGFYLAYLQLKDRIMQYLESAPKLDLVVTGHSLGAAMGSLCAYDIINTPNSMGFKSVSSITFGEPRTGNMAFQTDYGMKIPNAWRVTHYKDIVPKVPFQTFGFYHTAREIWYNAHAYAPGAYRICDGSGEDPLCQNSLWFATSVEDHLYYLGTLLGSGGCLDPVVQNPKPIARRPSEL